MLYRTDMWISYMTALLFCPRDCLKWVGQTQFSLLLWVVQWIVLNSTVQAHAHWANWQLLIVCRCVWMLVCLSLWPCAGCDPTFTAGFGLCPQKFWFTLVKYQSWSSVWSILRIFNQHTTKIFACPSTTCLVKQKRREHLACFGAQGFTRGLQRLALSVLLS